MAGTGVKIASGQLNTIQLHNGQMRSIGGSLTEYNALGASTFQSPSDQRKTKGFVDFDLQLFRPQPQKSNAHEKRFEPYNYFPKTNTDNKPI